MGIGGEWIEDNAYELNSRYEEIREELSECSDDKLISKAISVGAELDNFDSAKDKIQPMEINPKAAGRFYKLPYLLSQ